MFIAATVIKKPEKKLFNPLLVIYLFILTHRLPLSIAKSIFLHLSMFFNKLLYVKLNLRIEVGITLPRS